MINGPGIEALQDIRIEPDWNVNDYELNELMIERAIRIEPDWNVNVYKAYRTGSKKALE